jgi:hypothetical protein
MSSEGNRSQVCEHCGAAMKLARTVPRLGALPELRTYRCQRCESVMTIVVEAEAVA